MPAAMGCDSGYDLRLWADGSPFTCDPCLKSFHMAQCHGVWWRDARSTTRGPLAAMRTKGLFSVRRSARYRSGRFEPRPDAVNDLLAGPRRHHAPGARIPERT